MANTDPNSNPKVDMEAEFPTEWHREQYIRDNERGLEAAILNGRKDEEAAHRKELKRLGHEAADSKKAPAAKRPAAAKKATR